MRNGGHKRRNNQRDQQRRSHDPEDDSGNKRCVQAAWPWRRGHGGDGDGGGVRWKGCVELEEGSDGGSDGGESLASTRSLTDGDLEELKGCLDLGFAFSYDEIPGLCPMLPALELCYSMSRLLGGGPGGAGNAGGDAGGSYEAIAALPVANWKISSPGDHPDEVKARLKIWAQAVACTVRLHS